MDVDQIDLRSICKGFFRTQKSAEATLRTQNWGLLVNPTMFRREETLAIAR